MWIIKININRGWSPWCIEYKWTKKLNDFFHNKDDQNSKSKWPRITGFCHNKLILYSPLSNSISDCMMFASASILAQASSLHTVPTRMITSSTQSSSQAPVKVRSSYIYNLKMWWGHRSRSKVKCTERGQRSKVDSTSREHESRSNV